MVWSPRCLNIPTSTQRLAEIYKDFESIKAH